MAGLLVGSLGLTGCGAMTAASNEAQVRFVDTSVDAPALDLYLNGAGAAYNLSYATFSSYLPVSAGSYQVSANRAFTGQALTTAHTALAGGRQYTAVVGGSLGNLQEHLYADTVPPVVPGTVAVRVLQEADSAPVDVYLVPHAAALAMATPVTTGLGYGANSGYFRVPANQNLLVYTAAAGTLPTAGNATRAAGVSINAPPGAARTLVLAEPGLKEGRGLFGMVLDDTEAP